MEQPALFSADAFAFVQSVSQSVSPSVIEAEASSTLPKLALFRSRAMPILTSYNRLRLHDAGTPLQQTGRPYYN